MPSGKKPFSHDMIRRAAPAWLRSLRMMGEDDRRSFLLHRRGFMSAGAALVAAAALPKQFGCAAIASTQTGGDTPVRSGLPMHWWAGGPARAMANTNGVDIRGNFILYGYAVGRYPHRGPHELMLDRDLMRQHLAKLRIDIRHRAPDPQDSRFAAINWESWWPTWSHTHDSIRQRWRDYLQATRASELASRNEQEREEFARMTFQQKAREFFETSLLVCAEERPNMKFGLYALPRRNYWTLVPGNEAAIEAYIDREVRSIPWMWQAQGAIFPSVYTFYRSDGGPGPGYDTPENHARYISRNLRVAEAAAQIGGGKPVLPFVWWQYHQSNNNPEIKLEPLSELNWRITMDEIAASTAAGFIYWAWFNADSDGERLRLRMVNWWNTMARHHVIRVQGGRPVSETERGTQTATSSEEAPEPESGPEHTDQYGID